MSDETNTIEKISEKITILSVDDNDANLYARGRILRREGFAVVEALNGADALRLVRELKPPLVLCDVQMPDINGLEVCRLIKTDPELISTFVLQISASLIEPQDKARALDGGADAYLTEPVEPEELLATVRALLRLHRAEIDLRQTQTNLAAALRAEQEARQAAETATRLKDEFLAVISHELRSPLNSILGWNQFLMRGADEATVRRAAVVIERQGAQQLRLIEDLIDTSRITMGKMRLEVQPVELAEVILAALDTVRPAAAAKNILLLPDFDKDAGQISGDSDRLQQVVWNLLTNAVKFTPSGGTVFVGLRRESSNVALTVRDTGQGIEPKFLPFVFDRFRQADASTSRRFGGLGLGLALVRHLIEMHGGTVTAESTGENQGTTFTARFPLRAIHAKPEFLYSSEPENPAQSVSAMEAGNNQALAGVSALVVDDETDSRELIAQTLAQFGALVKTVKSGAEALAQLNAADEKIQENLRFTVLICDIGMPFEDGFATLGKIRRLADDYARLPAIALTAYARQADRDQAFAAGFQEYLTKPVQTNILVDAINSLRNTRL